MSADTVNLFFYDLSKSEVILLYNNIKFGRNKGDVNFPQDGSVSGLHCQVNIDGPGRVSITDLGSKNKTKVNGAEIEANIKHSLELEDIVEIGEQKFMFTDEFNPSEKERVQKRAGQKILEQVKEKEERKLQEREGQKSGLERKIHEFHDNIAQLERMIIEMESKESDFLSQAEKDQKSFVASLEEVRKNYLLRLKTEVKNYQENVLNSKKEYLKEIEDLKLKIAKNETELSEIQSKEQFAAMKKSGAIGSGRS